MPPDPLTHLPKRAQHCQENLLFVPDKTWWYRTISPWNCSSSNYCRKVEMTNPVSAPLIYKSSITLTCLLKDLPAVSLTCRYSRSWLYHQSSQEGKGLSCDGNLTPIVTTNSLPQEICFLFLQISANPISKPKWLHMDQNFPSPFKPVRLHIQHWKSLLLFVSAKLSSVYTGLSSLWSIYHQRKSFYHLVSGFVSLWRKV